MIITKNTFLLISFILVIIDKIIDCQFFFLLSFIPAFFYLLIFSFEIPEIIKKFREKKRKKQYFSDILKDFKK